MLCVIDYYFVMQKYIFCLTYKCCIYEIYDFFNVVGAEPMYGGIAFEPRLLLTTVAPAVALYLEDALVERSQSVEVFKHLFVAHGVKGILCALWIDGECFLLESAVNHVENAGVDALVKHVTWACQTNLHDVEWAFLALALSERGVGLTCAVAYLKGMDNAAWVVAVDDRPVLWVEQLQFSYQSLQPFVG